MSRRLLTIVAHGSHLDSNSSRPLHVHAARLRASGDFDEVRVGSWKEEPSLARCLDGTEGDDVTVVPLFISDGYFTRTVIPREMRLDGPLTRRDGGVVRCTKPVGTHPALADVLAQRAREAGATATDAIAVLGHGTPRDPNSERSIYEQSERLAAMKVFAEVTTVFIDQEPSMLRIFDRTAARRVIVVPLFISDGWHVGQTIPRELALDTPCTRPDGRTLLYASAAGTHAGVADVIAELAREAAQW